MMIDRTAAILAMNDLARALEEYGEAEHLVSRYEMTKLTHKPEYHGALATRRACAELVTRRQRELTAVTNQIAAENAVNTEQRRLRVA